MKKLLLKCFLSPGDIVMLTAAVRDLHQCYPNQFITDVRTSCPALWENNPYITSLSDDDPSIQHLDCECSLINLSNRLPYHYIHAFIHFLNDRLGLAIRPTQFRGDIHLSAQEKAWYSQVQELAGIDLPFWIVAAGGKYDLTIKWWHTDRYQAVIDAFKGRVQFVQIGAKGHFHPKLKGAIDLRGQTNLRELIRLVYHSQGVLCGVTAAMHLAAAVEPKYGRTRPCVVIAGGREAAHWEQYPDHQFLTTNGTLPCCSRGGCWRSRTQPLGDGDDRDQPEHLCVDVLNGLPHCMEMISADDVIRRITYYFSGGTNSFLSDAELTAARIAVEKSERNPYDETALTLHNARIFLERFIGNLPPPPFIFHGCGIVICAGGVRYFTNAWVCVHVLRRLGCSLPIEVWHLGGEEMDPEMKALIEPLGVTCIDAREVAKRFPVRRLGGWESKAFAICFSHYKEILYLDADNVPVVNPDFLFDLPQYVKTGAIFWPDLPPSKENATAWESCGLKSPGLVEFESGQIVVDKSRCWEALRLALWFNEHSDFYYQHVYGDKETFHLAFHKMKKPYAFVPTPVERLVGTMCQHDFTGRRIFQHRNTDKWNVFLRNHRVQGFLLENECLEYVRDLRNRWDGRVARYLTHPGFVPQDNSHLSPVQIEAVMISCVERDEVRAKTLANLSQTDWGRRPVHIQIDSQKSDCKERSQTENAYLALQAGLLTAATHILFLEDDLDFNVHLLRNLESWEPIRTGILALGSLYNPGMRPTAWSATGNFALGRPTSCYGSQAFVLARHAVKFILDHWNEIEGKQDLKISRLASRLQPLMFYHAPSLVQHVGEESTWGGEFHKARDFDRDWEAITRAESLP